MNYFVRLDAFGHVLELKVSEDHQETPWIEIPQVAYDQILKAGRSATYIDGVVRAIEPKRPLPNLTPRQFELMLVDLNMDWSEIEQAIEATHPGEENKVERRKALVELNRATQFARSHPLVALIATKLKFPSDQFDALWRHAAAL